VTPVGNPVERYLLPLPELSTSIVSGRLRLRWFFRV
jgi:hypothetical protein